ncbi:MAG: cyclic nucleotide-binding domain-containing protein [Acidimicrobiales bacterium]|nr:cyclic nucleotide-binding domain-containing protein [Acidimicrobiales bacterium]
MSKHDAVERLQSIPMFAELSSRELKRVSKLMTQIEVREGRDLTTEGEVGREFMIIVEGSAVVRRKGRKIAELGPGDFFGELAVLSGEPRNATVTAATPMTLEALNRREFMSLLDEEPKIAKKVLLGAVKRLQEVESSKTS